MTIPTLVAVAVAGAFGALARLGLTRALATVAGDVPFATGLINVTGCFVFGLLWTWAAGRWSPVVQAAVFTGFLGAFTTFSTFAFECVELARAERWAVLAGNVLLQNGLGIAAVVLGRTLARVL